MLFTLEEMRTSGNTFQSKCSGIFVFDLIKLISLEYRAWRTVKTDSQCTQFNFVVSDSLC